MNNTLGSKTLGDVLGDILEGVKVDGKTGSTFVAPPGTPSVALYNLNAERDVLGALLFDNNNLNHVGDIMRPEYFYERLHGKLFELIRVLIDRGRVADPTTLENHFNNDTGFKDIGGSEYLYGLVRQYAQAAFAFGVATRAEIVHDLYLRRRTVEIIHGAKLAIETQDATKPATTHLEHLEASLFELATKDEGTSGGFISLEQSMRDSVVKIKQMKESGGSRGIPSGFVDLDEYISGWNDSDLVIIAARPSMGKSSLAISIALRSAEAILKAAEGAKKLEEKSGTAKSDKPYGCVGVFSLEMPAEQLAIRILSVYSGVSSHLLVNGKASFEDIKKIAQTAEDYSQLPIYIDDTPALSISALRTRARRLSRQKNLKMIVVDYLQLLKGSFHSDNRVQEISEITQGLKAIAKELSIPVLALSQLSRNVEAREDKRPQLQDLRESGSIEQDADIVMFIYREAYYLERTRPQHDSTTYAEWAEKNLKRLNEVENKAEIIIGKHRNGPIGTVELHFDPNTTKFDNLAKTHGNSGGGSGGRGHQNTPHNTPQADAKAGRKKAPQLIPLQKSDADSAVAPWDEKPTVPSTITESGDGY